MGWEWKEIYNIVYLRSSKVGIWRVNSSDIGLDKLIVVRLVVMGEK